MSTTTPEQTHEACVPTWYGQHLPRATVLSSDHIATVSAALTGIKTVVDLLNDRESQRAAGEAQHQLNPQANQPQTHGQQSQAATKTVAPKPTKRATSTSAQPIQ